MYAQWQRTIDIFCKFPSLMIMNWSIFIGHYLVSQSTIGQLLCLRMTVKKHAFHWSVSIGYM